MQKITTWLWFDTEGEEAAKFYTSIFANSKITDTTRYGSAGPRPEGTVMTVAFELEGREFVALKADRNSPSTRRSPSWWRASHRRRLTTSGAS